MQYDSNSIKLFPSETGIYSIEFLDAKNGKIYVGSAGATVGHKSQIGFRVRWRGHLKLLRKLKHHSIKLQRAYNKYGEERLRFKVLEFCDPKDCIDRENFYIRHHDSCKNGYNMQPNAQSSIGRKQQKSSLKKLSDTMKARREVFSEKCISLYLELESVELVAEQMPFSRATVLTILKENNIPRIKSIKTIRKKVFCYMPNGDFVGEFLGITECAKALNIKYSSNISCAAKGYLNKSCNGYVFSYTPLSKDEAAKKYQTPPMQTQNKQKNKNS